MAIDETITGLGPASIKRMAVTRSPGRRVGHFAKEFGLSLVRSRPKLLVVLIVVLGAYMTIAHSSQFMTTGNLQAVAINATTDAILVVGMMILMIAGVFDLSIGSTLGLSGVASAMFVVNLHQSTAVAILAGLAVGAICGLVNGLIVVKIRINALIATLATLGIFEGITQLLSGNGVDQISNNYAAVGQNTFLGLQLPVWIAVVIVGAAAFAVGRTTYFRRFYFIGGNQKAARLSGIRVDRLVLTAFVLMGVLAGVAGVLEAARLNAAVVSAGTGEELTVITAAVLGGASLAGGEGKIFGGVLGVIFLSLVTNCLIIIGVTVFWQNIVVGLVLLVAVSLDRWKRASRL